MEKKTRRSKRVYKEHEFLARDFKMKLRRLNMLAATKKFEVYNLNEAPAYSTCVLSTDDYEIGNHPRQCAAENTAFFVTEHIDEILEELGFA